MLEELTENGEQNDEVYTSNTGSMVRTPKHVYRSNTGSMVRTPQHVYTSNTGSMVRTPQHVYKRAFKESSTPSK